MDDKLKELQEKWIQKAREYEVAEHEFYKYSDGFQYLFCIPMNMNEEGLRELIQQCPFCTEPYNAVALWYEEFHDYGTHPFILFTNNTELRFDTACKIHRIVHCSAESINKLKKAFIDVNDELMTKHKSTRVYFAEGNPPYIKCGDEIFEL